MKHERLGLTLLELVVVLVILVALAAIVVPLVSNHTSDSQAVATRTTMRRLQDVLMNQYWPDMYPVNVENGVNHGFPQPLMGSRQAHPQLRYLFINPVDESNNQDFDPVHRRGWRGSYLQHNGFTYTVAGTFTDSFGLTGDPSVSDGWGRPIVIQQPTDVSGAEQVQYTRLISAGPNGIINTPSTKVVTKDQSGDDILLYLKIADPRN